MDIMDRAVELGRAIAESKELQEYKKYEQEVELDNKAKELFSEFKKLQIELVRATRDNKDKETIEVCKNRLIAKQAEIDHYDITRGFLTAKSNFDKLMKSINDVIIFSVTGENSCSSGNCSSCSGCK